MTKTTYFDLNIVEGTDIVNPLVVDNPNYDKIDEVLHDNAISGTTLATELTNGTVHAISRENSECAVIRFIATSEWKAGDTVTVDGVPVTALLASGETLPDGAYVINANVLCILTGTNLTVYAGGKKAVNANEIKYKNTNVEAELDTINGSLVNVNNEISEINSSLNERLYHVGDVLTFNNAMIPALTSTNGLWIPLWLDKQIGDDVTGATIGIEKIHVYVEGQTYNDNALASTSRLTVEWGMDRHEVLFNPVFTNALANYKTNYPCFAQFSGTITLT